MRMVMRPWDEPLPMQTVDQSAWCVEFWVSEKLTSAMDRSSEGMQEKAVDLVGKVIEGFVIDHWTGDRQTHSNEKKADGRKLTVFVTIANNLTDADGDRLELQSPFVALKVAGTLGERARNLVGAMV